MRYDHYQDPTAARPIDLAFWVIVLLLMAMALDRVTDTQSVMVDRMQETVDACQLMESGDG